MSNGLNDIVTIVGGLAALAIAVVVGSKILGPQQPLLGTEPSAIPPLPQDKFLYKTVSNALSTKKSGCGCGH